MTENKDTNYGLEFVLVTTVLLYFTCMIVCCATIFSITTKDLSLGALKSLLWFNIGFFLTLPVPSVIYLIVELTITIKNKIEHYVDVFHYYEELKSDEDKKHLLYNNKSKMKP